MLPDPAPEPCLAPVEALGMIEPLRAVLDPQPGERILEVGAGTGAYALHVAAHVYPGGTIDILDALPTQLETAMRGARERAISNVNAMLGDARFLPYEDASFDAAYAVAALGDAPDPETVLAELARVLRPGGRLVVGELHGDPHRFDPARLRDGGVPATLRFARQVDAPLGSFTVLERPPRGRGR
jgi:ubiquinone/menaquinone biosynthesis C-methylase UbiE